MWTERERGRECIFLIFFEEGAARVERLRHGLLVLLSGASVVKERPLPWMTHLLEAVAHSLHSAPGGSLTSTYVLSTFWVGCTVKRTSMLPLWNSFSCSMPPLWRAYFGSISLTGIFSPRLCLLYHNPTPLDLHCCSVNSVDPAPNTFLYAMDSNWTRPCSLGWPSRCPCCCL